MNQPPIPEFLSREEVAEVDAALLNSQDKFLTRITLYSLRVLKQIAASEQESSAPQSTPQPVRSITDQQIAAWIEQDEALKQTVTTDATFEQFFIRLVLSSLKPLRQIATELEQPIEALTNRQVVSWFEARAKQRLDASQAPS
ncbi:MAG: hypothetical protein KME07_16445 [Pegethrix bostrychoides GSE-TBD4-15B]|jgi:hypothetical protein|uniref:Uncharacterized protein n=1 Tax=Pegethrix bostrychoides GSE-TBD4-15B TaxID=2839662 RepID=A0A951PDE2_9CYAN|nr:hypothetical protein [Pegethrix bostrychoides GSE-TBD4-15B]